MSIRYKIDVIYPSGGTQTIPWNTKKIESCKNSYDALKMQWIEEGVMDFVDPQTIVVKFEITNVFLDVAKQKEIPKDKWNQHGMII